MALGVPFGNYRLVRRIARGGMAEVFLAWQLSSSLSERSDEEADGFYDSATGIRFARQVAVKRILPHLSESEEFRALFLQEARLAATLSHPNVVHVYDFGRTGDCLFLVMELIEGVGLGTLARATRSDGRGALPVEYAVRIAADALAGLHHAHTRTDAAGRPQHIVHRDVSPQNVMITLDGVVKILDFGIAKAAWSAQETRPGVIRGKYAYMSPEQAEGQKLDGRSDVYAVGVCLYELLTGAPLVPRDLPLDAALRAVRGGVALQGLGQLELLRPDVPPQLHAILRRALQTRRDHRYSSAAEMQLELERFLKNWPHMSSSLLLGEYLRQHHLRPVVSEFDDEQAGHVTPVRTPPATASPLRVVPGTALFAAVGHEGPTRTRFASSAGDTTLIAGAGTDAVADRQPSGSEDRDEHVETARVSLPTVLVSRAALPTWRPGRRQQGEPDTARTALPDPVLARPSDPLATAAAGMFPTRAQPVWFRGLRDLCTWHTLRDARLLGPLCALLLVGVALTWRSCP